MKPRVLANMFSSCVDGQIDCELGGSDKTWIDESNPDIGGLSYAPATGVLTASLTGVCVPTYEMLGGLAVLNQTLTLPKYCDVRVRYSDLVLPIPGINNVLRVGLRLYDPYAGGGHNDCRVCMAVENFTAGVGLWRWHSYLGEAGYGTIKNVPAGYETTGWLRIVKDPTSCITYLMSATGWQVGGTVNSPTNTTWHAQLYSSVYKWSGIGVLPAGSLGFSEFGAYP